MAYKMQLKEIEGKIENIEESYNISKDMNRKTYDKFSAWLIKERDAIARQMASVAITIPNPMDTL